MVLPHAVPHDPPGEGVVGVGEPLRQRRPPLALGVACRQVEVTVYTGEGGDRTGSYLLVGLRHVAPRQDVDRSWLAAIRPGADERATAGVDRPDVRYPARTGELGEFAFSGRDLRTECRKVRSLLLAESRFQHGIAALGELREFGRGELRTRWVKPVGE